MNDLVRPTTLFSGARVAAVGPSGILGTVPNPPPQVSQLSAGSTLTGVVVGHDAGGHTLVHTDLGTLSVATKAQLPVNSEVTLHIRSSGGQLHVLIVHSELPQDGAKGAPAPQPLQPPGAQVGGARVGGTQTGGTGPQGQAATTPGAGHAVPAGHGPASDLLTLGQLLRAVVQSPAAAPNAAAGGAGQPPAGPTLSTLAAQLAPGSELQLRIISVQAPAAQAPGNPAPGSPASGAPTPGPQGPTTPGATAPGATAPGATAPGATAPGVPGGVPGLAGPIAAYGGLQGGAGQAGSPTAPGATPNQPNPAATTPLAAAPAAPTGQGAARPGVPAPASPAGAQAAPAPSSQPPGAAVPGGTPAPAAVTPASGVPASGAIASYAAASDASGASPQGPGQGPNLGAAANRAALLATHGINQDGSPVTPTRAAQPGAVPGADFTSGPGGGRAAAPASAAPAIPGPASGATQGAIQFTGTVTAVTHAGQPVLQTPLGTLTLEIRAPLQTGSRITFELPGGALAPSGPGAAGPGPAALGTLAHSWPALEETLRVLQEIAPGVAAAPLPAAIPQPGSRLASGLLFFLSALSGGDVTRWLGNQASQALKSAGRDSLLSRLGQDFGQLSRLADNQGGDWRLFFIPIHDGDQLRQLRLFLRHGWQDRDGGGAQDDDDPTRFVVEVEMSRLGELQLDGLVREKRLDLILRSRAPLPDFMRRDIMQIFHETNEITGNRGNIGFQSSLEWKAMPLEASEVAVDAGVVV
jgi:hypothetical protein